MYETDIPLFTFTKPNSHFTWQRTQTNSYTFDLGCVFFRVKFPGVTWVGQVPTAQNRIIMRFGNDMPILSLIGWVGSAGGPGLNNRVRPVGNVNGTLRFTYWATTGKSFILRLLTLAVALHTNRSVGKFSNITKTHRGKALH